MHMCDLVVDANSLCRVIKIAILLFIIKLLRIRNNHPSWNVRIAINEYL